MSWIVEFHISTSDGINRKGIFKSEAKSADKAEAELDEFYMDNPTSELLEMDGWDDSGDEELIIDKTYWKK